MDGMLPMNDNIPSSKVTSPNKFFMSHSVPLDDEYDNLSFSPSSPSYVQFLNPSSTSSVSVSSSSTTVPGPKITRASSHNSRKQKKTTRRRRTEYSKAGSPSLSSYEPTSPTARPPPKGSQRSPSLRNRNNKNKKKSGTMNLSGIPDPAPFSLSRSKSMDDVTLASQSSGFISSSIPGKPMPYVPSRMTPASWRVPTTTNREKALPSTVVMAQAVGDGETIAMATVTDGDALPVNVPRPVIVARPHHAHSPATASTTTAPIPITHSRTTRASSKSRNSSTVQQKTSTSSSTPYSSYQQVEQAKTKNLKILKHI